MTRPPLILISPNIEKKGDEFGDLSISLSETYQRALMGVGAIPMAMPATAARELVAECVRRADGVLLTGGEDVEPLLYAKKVPAKLRRTVTVTPDGGRGICGSSCWWMKCFASASRCSRFAGVIRS